MIVKGTVVVKDSEVLTGPGQPIRFEPPKSRFEPVTMEGWTQKSHAPPIDFGGGVPGSQPDLH